MEHYTLEDLYTNLNTDPRVKEALFQWHRHHGLFGGPFGNEHNGRMNFEARLIDPNTRELTVNPYLNEYTIQRNQRLMREKLIRAGIIAGTGLVAIITGIFADQKAAKLLLEVGGATAEVGSAVGAGYAFIRHRV